MIHGNRKPLSVQQSESTFSRHLPIAPFGENTIVTGVPGGGSFSGFASKVRSSIALR